MGKANAGLSGKGILSEGSWVLTISKPFMMGGILVEDREKIMF